MRMVRFWLLALLSTSSLDALAAETREAGEYRVAITPIAGYRMGGDIDGDDDDDEPEVTPHADNEVSLDDDALFGLVINLPADSVTAEHYTEWEIYVARQSVGIDRAPVEVDPSLELDITHILLGGTYVGGGTNVRPFLSAGLGAAHLSPDGADYDSDTVFAFSLGAGAQIFPASRVGLRLEGRVLGSVIDSDSALFCASGPSGSGCAFRASGDMLWQWEVFAGLTFRL